MRGLLFTAALLTAGPALGQEATRALTNITGDVWRFQNNAHYGLVVVSGEGVAVADPISAEAAAWLEAKLAEITDQPVTHLIYSHSHGDHASGGAVFADTATVIAHENAPETIDGVEVDQRIGDTGSLSLGDKTLEFTWLGAGHGEDLMAFVVRPENVAFVVDAVSHRRLPWRDFGGADVDGLAAQIAAVEALDFDILAGGHGPLGDAESAAEAAAYLETLRSAVREGLGAGKTVEELQAELTLDDYAEWEGYADWRALNIEGMAGFLKASGAVD